MLMLSRFEIHGNIVSSVNTGHMQFGSKNPQDPVDGFPILI